MASMRDIKRRKESIQSTSQITKAMKLVSTVKLQKAKGRAEETKPYFEKMYHTVSGMLAKSGGTENPYVTAKSDGGPKKKGVILITSNRGLAGGYNSNMIKLVTQGDFDRENTIIFPVGRKGLEAMKRQGYTCSGDFSEVMNNPLFGDAVSIGKTVTGALENGEIDEVYLAYTVFKNTVTQIPTLIKILPFSEEDIEEEQTEKEASEEKKGPVALMNYEPEEEETLGYIIPLYVNSLIFGALVEAVASENGARMQAMDSATSNAEEMIDTLGLQYNRARQAAITQELTEIVAGASAIS
ncbi:MAG: ATP synthase F1 subunit gamma [Lachnospiraceae bacterium]|nr:ATP synthase F1 subunit gamma [Lachnospiraceae bacterium]